MNVSLANDIYSMAISHGYEDCGIIPISKLQGYAERMEKRIETYPFSAAVYGFRDAFMNVEKVFPWAKSAVVCTYWLGQFRYPRDLQGKYAKCFMLSPNTDPSESLSQGRKAFEAWMQEQGIRFAGGEDNLPAGLFPLRYAAVEAGLGIFRKNNFFYGPQGSYYLLEGYLIDRECEHIGEVALKPCPENCTLCQKACKTKALSAPYAMDPLSCVSFWTTFGQGTVPDYLEAQDFQEWICGCDDCQDACPFNRRHNWDEGESYPELDNIVDLLQPKSILAASNLVLQQKVSPKSEGHIPPDQVETFRRGARRCLDNQSPGNR